MGVKMFCLQAIDYIIYQRYNKTKNQHSYANYIGNIIELQR